LTIVKIAFRNLSRQKKRTIFLAGAIAFGILAVTLLDSMTGSFVTNISRNFSDLSGGHIYIDGKELSESGREVSVIRDTDLITEGIVEADVDYMFITHRSSFQGTLFFEGNSVSQNIVGADWEKEAYFIERIVLRDGSFKNLNDNEAGIVISEDVAEILGVHLGDRVTVKMRTATGQFNSGYLYIEGISVDPGFIGSIATYANIANVNRLLNIGSNDYMTMGIYFSDMDMVDTYIEPLREVLKTKIQVFEETIDEDADQDMFTMMMAAQEEEETWDGVRYSIVSIHELLSELDQIIRIIDTASLIFFFVLLLIIMVGINNTFRIVMMERVREIGTMRAIGTQRNEVGQMFIMEALFIALGGMIAGYLVSGIAMLIVTSINLGMDSPIFIVLRNGHFTFTLNAVKILRNTLIVSLLTVFAALLPAFKASRLEPAEALRTQK